MRKYVLPAALACGLAACSESPSAPPRDTLSPSAPASFSKSGDPIAGQYIVQFRPGGASALSNAKYVEHTMGGATKFVYSRVMNGAAMQLSDDAATALRSDPRVLSVDQDQVVSMSTTQTNPPSWGLDRIDQRNLPLSLSYSYGLTGSGVTAYILDTGLNFSQADFGGRAFAGIDEITLGGGSVDCNGHGTHTAGTVGSATYGVAKQVKIVAVRVLDCSGNGSFAAVIAGIDWVTANATLPAVASMSLGGSNFPALDTAVAHSMAAGIPYVIAAGNSSANACLSSPGNTPGAITIGATTITDVFASFSDRGPCVALNAPGVGIKSLWIGANGTTNTISGTSMATPHVSGVVALYLQANPTATPGQARAAVVGNATPNVITSVPAGTPNLLLNTGFLSNVPVASFTSNCTGLSCSFDGSGSTALPIATYNWNFGDGTTGTGKTPNKTYATAGTYAVTLTVTDPNGTSVKTNNVNVGGAANQAPVASFTLTCPTLHCAADGSASTDDVGVVSYAWDWGNGRGETHVGPTANNTWAAPGVYNVSLTVRDAGGLTNTLVKQVTIPTPVGNQSPTATITAPTNGSSFVQGTPVQFTGSGQDPEDGALTGGSLVWTSNVSGQIGTGTSFSTSGLPAGPHTITLKGTDSQGAFGTASVQITITASNQPPVANFTFTCSTTGAHQCSVNGSSSTDDNGVVSYTWDWGNGRTETHVGPTSGNTWATAGIFNVTLRVKDAGGLTNSIVKAVTVP
jgi:PKD repeat protein